MSRRKKESRLPAGRNQPERPNQNPRQERPGGAEEAPDRLRPWLVAAVCALFVVRPLYASESAATEGVGMPVVMLWLVLAVVWLLGVIGRREFRLRFGWTDAALLLLIVLHTISAVWGAAHGSPRPAVNILWEWIGLGAGFLLARQFLVGPRESRAVVAAMLGLAVALSAHGYYQYFYEMPATRAAYQADRERLLREAGLSFDSDSRQLKLFEDRLNSPEPLASFELTNSLAGFLAPWLVVAAGIGIFGVIGLQDRKRLWIVTGVIAVALGGCLVLTMSRSGYIATLLGFVLIGAWAGRKVWRNWKLLAAFAIVIAALVGAGIATRGVDASVFTQAARSLGYRLQYWQSTTRMIADHPWLGVGPGEFQFEYTRYKLPEAAEEIADPHNFLLEVWATAGTPAALALLAVLGVFAGVILRRLRFDRISSPDAGTDAKEAARSEADFPRFALIGLAGGFLLALAIRPLVSVAPSPWLLLAGAVLAGTTVVLLWPWVERGHLPPVLPLIAVGVLLINLLAAGGIGFPAVAGTLWLWMAIGLNEAERAAPQAVTPTRPQSGFVRLSWGKGLILLGIALILTIACCVTAYWPVVHCRRAIEEARHRPESAEQHFVEAAAADPLSADPWEYLSLLAFSRWQERPSPQSLAAFRKSAEAFLARAPHSSSAWATIGNRYLAIFDKTAQREDLQQAITSLDKAVVLYPNSAVRRAHLALAFRSAQDAAGFREQAEEALRLDESTPHPEKRLSDELRKELQRNVSKLN